MVEAHLRQQLSSFDADPGTADHERIRELRQRRDELQVLPEWPFATKDFTGVVSLAASSSLPAILPYSKRWADSVTQSFIVPR